QILLVVGGGAVRLWCRRGQGWNGPRPEVVSASSATVRAIASSPSSISSPASAAATSAGTPKRMVSRRSRCALPSVWRWQRAQRPGATSRRPVAVGCVIAAPHSPSGFSVLSVPVAASVPGSGAVWRWPRSAKGLTQSMRQASRRQYSVARDALRHKIVTWRTRDGDSRRQGPNGSPVGPWPAFGGGLSRRGDRRRSEEHTSELQSRENLVCRLLLEKKKHIKTSKS